MGDVNIFLSFLLARGRRPEANLMMEREAATADGYAARHPVRPGKGRRASGPVRLSMQALSGPTAVEVPTGVSENAAAGAVEAPKHGLPVPA